jgi:hypothetical protein
MTTKTFILRSIDLSPGLGNAHDGVPFRHLTSLVEQVRRIVPDDEEGTCKVRGAELLTFEYTHTLTPLERVQSDLDDMRAKADQIKAMLPRDGALTAEQTDALRRLLG